MKKIILALAVLAVAAGSALGATGVAIQWDTYWGAYTHDAADLTAVPGDYLLDSYDLTWQLIYSINATAGAPDIDNVAGDWVSGDDTVWATRTFTMGDGSASDGTEWTTDLYWSSGDRQYVNTAWSSGDVGYIYQRIYQGAPAVDSWYYDTTPVPLNADPDTYQSDYLDVVGGGTAGIQPNQQIAAAPVPEPATMGLLGLGALVMAIRRRRS